MYRWAHGMHRYTDPHLAMAMGWLWQLLQRPNRVRLLIAVLGLAHVYRICYRDIQVTRTVRYLTREHASQFECIAERRKARAIVGQFQCIGDAALIARCDRSRGIEQWQEIITDETLRS